MVLIKIGNIHKLWYQGSEPKESREPTSSEVASALLIVKWVTNEENR